MKEEPVLHQLSHWYKSPSRAPPQTTPKQPNVSPDQTSQSPTQTKEKRINPISQVEQQKSRRLMERSEGEQPSNTTGRPNENLPHKPTEETHTRRCFIPPVSSATKLCEKNRRVHGLTSLDCEAATLVRCSAEKQKPLKFHMRQV
ncbi:hypothetical protein E2C01_042381 [Portunus trituberculatus]|uniref:Uncharacterized protein n=1 Tax=Portunus trituberculatus TaxID=210409 RepID=A0A5B7FUI0_PORTR|nr:hypothetical protein [Portunus trituberculatus]